MIHMDQMILSEPPTILIWTYQDMMEWMSRILVGEMAGADEDLGSEVRQMWMMISFVSQNPHQLSMIHMVQMILSEPPTYLDISGHDGMDEQDIGWRNGWC
jgi:hypothetical protein